MRSMVLEQSSGLRAEIKRRILSIYRRETTRTGEPRAIFLKIWDIAAGQICVTQAYFPTKAYGDLVLPCGTYDTVQVVLGEGRGRNWWCVLYPSLCFIDSTHGVIPEQSKEELRGLLPEEDFSAVMDPAARVRIRLKLLELLLPQAQTS